MEKYLNEITKAKMVAHRLGYQMTNYPENSLDVIKMIFENKELLDACYGFEFDICFTKDHIPVVVYDKYIDDITSSRGLINDYTLEELKEMVFTFRRSIKNDKNNTYQIMSLEELLSFFEENKLLLSDKLIKIETKNYVFLEKRNFNLKNLKVLIELLNRYPILSNNIVHLSFSPLNLYFFRKIQKDKHYKLVKNDLLCDYNTVVLLSKYMNFLDNLSIRIKTSILPLVDENNSLRVNIKIWLDKFFMKYSNAITESNLRYIIKRYGTVGLYTLNSEEEIEGISSNISYDFLKENIDKIIITSNNPISFKRKKLERSRLK